MPWSVENMELLIKNTSITDLNLDHCEVSFGEGERGREGRGKGERGKEREGEREEREENLLLDLLDLFKVDDAQVAVLCQSILHESIGMGRGRGGER